IEADLPQVTPPFIPLLETDRDASGYVSTLQLGSGTVTANDPFFQSLGSNGRTCFTCHQPAQDWSFTPVSAKERYIQNGPGDPLFRLVDGANCPSDDPTKL